ncbi:hypothetical protein HHI36_018817 [Cryptolaemus montrouzieri]|uniref:Uncharacterized protein n=1 Tax=Cryptolaemus montrouzieri TaxID=559131 RepID=A0ABD2P1Q1_9CUCU
MNNFYYYWNRKMTTALYKQICENDSYKEKVKYIIEFDDVIDHLISKDIINEAEYMNIWNEGEGKLNTLFDTLSFKSNIILGKCFEVFKDIYGAEFERILKEINQDIIDYVHLRGRLPKISRYIPRLEEEAKLKEKFANIRWNNSLVVYGRVGEGKSYLVSQCLQDEELIWENFDNRLFWINVGDFENGSDIQQPLARLLQMLVQKQRKVYNIEELVEELQKLFSTEKPRKSLVILDNARSLELIETFQNIRCKLIITTHYKTVKHAEFLKVDSGFTLSETVSLFAQYLGTSCEKLNNFFSDDIKDIHELCKGHPSTLALIGDILSCKREYALTSRNLWEYIKEKIDKGEIEDLGNDDTCTTGRNFNRALKMCIDTIRTDEMKELYYQLSVFPKEANISTEVLEVFWGKNSWEVQDIMLHFENRSLINCFYNPNKKGYVYVIHDLFLYYLKNQTKAKKKISPKTYYIL